MHENPNKRSIPYLTDRTHTYENGNTLKVVHPEHGKTPAIVDYTHEGKHLRLNDLLPNTRWDIVPVISLTGKPAFEVLASKTAGIHSWAQVRLDIDALANERFLFATLHEIGHTHVYELLCEYAARIERGERPAEAIDNPELSRLLVYNDYTPSNRQRTNPVSELYSSNAIFCGLIGEARLKIFTERTASAYALKVIRRENLLPHITNPELREEYTLALETYVRRWGRRYKPNPVNPTAQI